MTNANAYLALADILLTLASSVFDKIEEARKRGEVTPEEQAQVRASYEAIVAKARAAVGSTDTGAPPTP